MPACSVCGHTEGNRTFEAQEMMFGTREAFAYLECNGCGCLHLLDVPEDLAPYYPEAYYAFETTTPGLVKKLARQVIDPYRARHGLNGTSRIGKGLARLMGMPEAVDWLKRAGVGFPDAILDVGCGNGLLLQQLQRMGFTDLTGVDPYIAQDLHYEGGLTIHKKEVQDLDRTYDFIMLHHVFEHLADPLGALRNLYHRLNPGRYLLIRIPVASSYAWQTYGTDWVQLDAPRHLFLHTYQSMAHLAQTAGFSMAQVDNDSTAFQFWGSEQYRQGIPLMDDRSYLKDKQTALFTPDQIADFEARARALNAQQQGDAACFYLYKTDAAA